MPAVTADQLPPDMTIVNEVLSWNRTSPQTLQSHVIVTPSLHLISTRSSRSAAASSCSHTAALSDARQGVYRRSKDEDETPLLCDRSPLAFKRNENRGLARASHSHAVSVVDASKEPRPLSVTRSFLTWTGGLTPCCASKSQ